MKEFIFVFIFVAFANKMRLKSNCTVTKLIDCEKLHSFDEAFSYEYTIKTRAVRSVSVYYSTL